MGFSVSSLSSYTDKATNILTSKVLFSNRTDLFSLEDDVQGSKYINTVAATLYRQAGSCGLSESGTTTWGQVILTVKPVAYSQRFCYEDLQAKALKIERQSIAKGAEPMVEEALINEFVNQVNKDVWAQLWIGATASGYQFDGWMTQALAATDRVFDSTTSAYTYNQLATGSNINTLVQAMCSKAVNTEGVWAAANEAPLSLFVSQEIFNLYRLYLISANLYRIGPDMLAVKTLDIPGYEGLIQMVETPELHDATGTNKPKMLLTYGKNLYLGASIVDEATAPTAKIVVDDVTDYVYFKSAMRIGAAIGVTAHCITNY